MNWYQPIECDNTVKKPLVVCEKNFEENKVDRWDFTKGEIINNWNSKILFQAEEEQDDGEPDDALQASPLIPIYSRRLVDKLNEANIEGIQYLPVTILKYNGESAGEFYIANFLNFIEAFDFEKSKYSIYDDDYTVPEKRGKVSGALKYVLKEAKLKEYDVIRLKEFSLRFFVSEKFRKVFIKNKFTGYSFKKIELT